MSRDAYRTPAGGAHFKLEELARAAEVSPRTVRYYVQRGLLPAPAFHGKDTTYGQEHLVRLRAIKRMQEAYFPLEAIAAALAGRSLAEIERIAGGELPPGPGRSPEPSPAVVPLPAPSPSPPSPSPVLPYGPTPPARYARWELAPGLELHLSLEASDDVRALAEKLLTHAHSCRGDRR